MKVLKNYYDDCKKKLLSFYVPLWIVLTFICYKLNELILCSLTSLANNPQFTYITISNLSFVEFIVSLFIEFLTPTTGATALYFFTLKYINEKGWKKKYPQYDISGEWLDRTTYTNKVDNDGWSTLVGQTVLSPAIIKQTCCKVSIEPSVGADFKWYSLLADWDENNTLRIFYTVEYYAELQKNGYPERRTGYECMDILGFREDGKPCKMVGKFWHCISNDSKPVYMGNVVYERNNKEEHTQK